MSMVYVGLKKRGLIKWGVQHGIAGRGRGPEEPPGHAA